MKKIFRSKNIARKIANKISFLSSKFDEEIKIMHVCGTHEHTITYYGLRTLLPDNVELVAGPGCPVCIVPAKEIDEAIELSLKGIKVYTYGDMYKVPGSKYSLAEARSLGGNVEVIYGFYDVLDRARKDGVESIFFAVGFETTVPTVASHIVEKDIPENLRLLVSYRLTVPALKYVLDRDDIVLKGVIAPGHVSTITGAYAWRFVSEKYNIPVVIAGFEPIDVLLAVYIILKQLVENKIRLVNEYSRVVSLNGNLVAKKYILEAFKKVDGLWRGIGILPKSRLMLRKKYSYLDARKLYSINVGEGIDLRPGCKCGEVVLGIAKPTDCPLFMKRCTPQTPYGACMVSSEGTCNIWAKYGGYIKYIE
ncbi:MAG: hydrogenase formation protein HypD [Thermoprotei archaeon]|nr:MAG: hydrogenase formation protein HypD [Thermoprotei archaeon]